jgi:hypothetical protein
METLLSVGVGECTIAGRASPDSERAGERY